MDHRNRTKKKLERMFRSFSSSLYNLNTKIFHHRPIIQIFETNNQSFWNIDQTSWWHLQIRTGRHSAKTRKIRKTFPFHWWSNKQKTDHRKEHLTEDNKKFIENVVEEKTLPFQNKSPLKIEQFLKGEYQEGSIRCGVIAKKLGIQQMWTKNGDKITTTALQIVDNHVVSYMNNEDFVRHRRPTFLEHHKFRHLDVLVVGAENSNFLDYPSSYLGLFKKAQLPPKKKLTRFFITPNAKLTPGTHLTVNHFRVGNYVDANGLTKDHGFQGVLKRWKFKGLSKHQGVTKAHKRPGTIARGRKLMGPLKGFKMAGHMGGHRRTTKGLKIWRINTKYNVIWVNGRAVPGGKDAWVYLYDTTLPYK